MPTEQAPAGGSPWRTVGAIASQTAVLVAVLFYFGWASTRATFEYFGADVSLLGFATSDFLLRSVYSAYQPLLSIGLVAVVCVCAHQLLMARVGSGDARWVAFARKVPPAVLGVGALAAAVGVIGLVVGPVSRTLGDELPAVLAGGALAIAYADHVWPRLRGDDHPLASDDAARRLRAFLLVAVTALAAFWWLALFAEETGEDRGAELAADLPSEDEIALYVVKPLGIGGHGVHRDVLQDEELKYHYRYTGLRLLVRAGGQYFLLPSQWRQGRDPLYLIREGDDVRLESIAAR